MYDVIKDIKDIKFIEVYKSFISKNCTRYRLDETKVWIQNKVYDKPIDLHPMKVKRLPNKCSHAYNNVIIKSRYLPEELIIFQDYGRDECGSIEYKDWECVPSELILNYNRFNIGFYGNKLVLVSLVPKVCIKLVILTTLSSELIDPLKFNQKRPFDARFQIEPNWNFESGVHLWVRLRGYDEEYLMSIGTGIKYKDLINPKRLSALSMIMYNYYTEFIDKRNISRTWMDSEYLLDLGFSYDPKLKCFIKGKCAIKREDQWHFILLSDSKGKSYDLSLWKKSDLVKYLK